MTTDTIENFNDVEVHPVGGVRQAAVASGIRYKDRLDLVLLELAPGSTVSGVFTRNQFCAAPVTIAKKHLQQMQQAQQAQESQQMQQAQQQTQQVQKSQQMQQQAQQQIQQVQKSQQIQQAQQVQQAQKIRKEQKPQQGEQQQHCYLLINTGNANAGTGVAGEQAALICCQNLATLAGVEANQVLPFSTGVIGEPLPMAPIRNALPTAFTELAENNWPAAAQGILTTDTRPKLRSIRLQLSDGPVHITGIAKGSGMIKPNMATMLAFICTDAALPQSDLDALLQQAVNTSFNRITVDGDTSTNDACILAATGASGIALERPDHDKDWQNLSDGVADVFRQLAQDLIRDAEGAGKFITVTVAEGESVEECLKVAYTVAESPLVKTACFASDPNWGRILAAVGRADIPRLNIQKVDIHLNGTAFVQNGNIHPDYTEAQGKAAMTLPELHIVITLNRGPATETVWTSDLSHEYIRINAEYRT